MGRIKQTLKHLKIFRARGFGTGFVIGLFYFSYIFWWFWALYPLDSLGIQNKAGAGLLIFITFESCVLISALWWGFFGYFADKFNKYIIPSLAIPVIAGTFTLSEYCRSIFFSIFWYGSGGAIGPYWPIGNPAYLFSDFKFISLSASTWGIYGIDFILALLVTGIAVLLLYKKNIKTISFQIILAVLILILAGNINVQDTKPAIPVTIIQTRISVQEMLNPDKNLEDLKNKLLLLEKASALNPDGIIVFPEGSNFYATLSKLITENEVQNYFSKLSKKDFLLLDSLRVQENDKFKSKAIMINSSYGLIGTYDKQILTPGGEFLPYIVKWPLWIVSPYLREQFKAYREFDKGSGGNIIPYKDINIKILICSELISPERAREGNPDFTIVMGSFAIWKGSPLETGQALAMLKLRAIENAKYTVLASNYGTSYIINPLGEVEKSSNPDSYELLTGSIIPNQERTWYNYVGDWPILLISSALFALGIRKIRNEFKS